MKLAYSDGIAASLTYDCARRQRDRHSARLPGDWELTPFGVFHEIYAVKTQVGEEEPTLGLPEDRGRAAQAGPPLFQPHRPQGAPPPWPGAGRRGGAAGADQDEVDREDAELVDEAEKPAVERAPTLRRAAVSGPTGPAPRFT